MPEPLGVEEEADNFPPPRPFQTSHQAGKPKFKTKRGRSNSLPVVHGNFLLLHRSQSKQSPDIW